MNLYCSECSIIFNPKATKFKKNYLAFIREKCFQKNILPKFLCSKKAGDVIDLVDMENKSENLIITLGGDGTVSEAIKGFQKSEKQYALYSHIATGTANDTCANFGLDARRPEKSTELILETGITKEIDILTVNEEPFAYVSAWGDLTNIPYDTSSKMKKLFGKGGYLITALPEIIIAIKDGLDVYNISYEHDGIKKDISCVMGFISNSQRFGGITVYPNASLNDGLFEVLFIKNLPKKMIYQLAKDFYQNNINIDNYSNFIDSFSTNDLIIDFHDQYLKKEIDNDGDKLPFNDNQNFLHYESKSKIKMLLPQKRK